MNLKRQIELQEFLFKQKGWKNWTKKRIAQYNELINLLK